MLKKLVYLLLAISVFFDIAAFAEAIVFKSGRTINAKIIKRTDEFIKVSILGGAIIYYLDEIESIGGINLGQKNLDIFVPVGSSWRYLDNGTDQGTSWRNPNFSDSNLPWKKGKAQLGYGDGDEATVVDFGPDEKNKYITTYFRHEFYVEVASGVSQLTLRLLRDDGAVVYLNGTEVVRDHLPAGATFDMLTTGYSSETDFFSYTVDPGLLIDGRNVLAVEVHQAKGSSSDISFDLQLEGK